MDQIKLSYFFWISFFVRFALSNMLMRRCEHLVRKENASINQLVCTLASYETSLSSNIVTDCLLDNDTTVDSSLSLSSSSSCHHQQFSFPHDMEQKKAVLHCVFSVISFCVINLSQAQVTLPNGAFPRCFFQYK